MITFNYETNFKLKNEDLVIDWVINAINAESRKKGNVNYIFCTDDYLSEINVKYLKHNTLTDIISFDYSLDKEVSGDIYISIERVKENSSLYNVSMKDELHRVIIHGILHFCGYTDKRKEEKLLMRKKEDYYLSLRTF